MKTRKILLVIILLQILRLIPIPVLAESLEIEQYKISINNNILNENKYNINSDQEKILNINQIYDGEEQYIYTPNQNLEIDFNNRLYGEYKYNLSVSNESNLLDAKTININYQGNNNKIINQNNLYYNDNTYYILGELNKDLTVFDILSKFNTSLENYNASLEVVDEDNNILLLDDIVENNHKLKLQAFYEDYNIENNIEQYYKLNIVDDINNDNKIDNLDIQKLMIEEILKETQSRFNILDVTNILLTEPTVEPMDNLITSLSHNNNVYLDNEIRVNYYIEGFNQDKLKGIEGNIKYNTNILKLIDIEIDSINGGYNENGKFIYLLEDYNQNSSLITFVFKPLKTGTTTIDIENITASIGSINKALLDIDCFESDINILEYAKGGDEEQTQPDEIIQNDEEKIEFIPEEKEISPILLNTTVLLSADNSIKKLSIKNYDINFNKDILEYQLDVKNNINNLDFNIELNDENSSYKVIGNDKLKSGENIIKIIVTAENGDEKTYTIKVNKESKQVIEETKEETSSSSKSIIIILMILIIIGLVYIIFKDDEEDKTKN